MDRDYYAGLDLISVGEKLTAAILFHVGYQL